MSMDISGTWRWIKHLDGDGNEEPLHAHYSTYTFGDDGPGSLDGPGILSYPLKWKIVAVACVSSCILEMFVVPKRRPPLISRWRQRMSYTLLTDIVTMMSMSVSNNDRRSEE